MRSASWPAGRCSWTRSTAACGHLATIRFRKLAGHFPPAPSSVSRWRSAALAALTRLKEAGSDLQRELTAKADALVAESKRSSTGSTSRCVWSIAGRSFLREVHHPAASLLFLSFHNEGVYILEGFPSYLSTAHTDDDLRLIVLAFREGLERASRYQVLRRFQSGGDDRRIPRAEHRIAARHLAGVPNVGDRLVCVQPNLHVPLRGPLDLPACRRFKRFWSGRIAAERLRRHRRISGHSPHLSAEVPVTDLSTLPPAEAATSRGRVAESADLEPFDLQSGPLSRSNCSASRPTITCC